MDNPADSPAALPAQTRASRLRGAAGLLRWLLKPRRLAGLAAVGLAGAVALLLVDMLEGVAARDVASAVDATSLTALVAAALASAGSYAALVGFERVAVQHLGAPVAPRLVALTGFISWAFTFVLGFGVVTGGAVRLRRYGRAGLGMGETLKITLFGAVFFWLGIAAFAGLSLIAAPGVLGPLTGLPDAAGLALGLAVILALGLWIARGGRVIRVGGQSLALPQRRTCLSIAALGILDTGLAALALWCLLPHATPLSFAAFLPIFAIATVAGVVSHAPGGVGAFEAVILISVPGEPSALLGALLVFRLVYYVTPFTLAAIAFAALEFAPQSRLVRALPGMVLPILGPLTPALLSAASFAAGLYLMMNAALDAGFWRMAAVPPLLPLRFAEASNLLSSALGVALLVLGAGLKRRTRASCKAVLAVLGVALVLSVVRGVDVEGAILFLGLATWLVRARSMFDRGGWALQAISAARLASVAGTVVLTVLVGLLADGGVPLPVAPWWDAALRLLGASLGATAALALLLVWRLIGPARPAAAREPDTGRVARAVATAADPGANLAFLGDKAFLFDDEGGFIMYRRHRGTYLALGDPVARCQRRAADLVWRFRELAHQNGGEPAFYQVSPTLLPLYAEAGFAFFKLGEEAVVDLATFSMAGSRATRYRQALTRGARAGLTFELVRAEGAAALLPRLKPISEAWLAQQSGQEKGFSLGFWDDRYLARFDHAVVWAGAEPVAFATLLPSGDGSEVAVDLMRHSPDLPGGTMDFLFVALIGALKERGAARLSLGMAPLAGLAEHRLAPTWSQVGATLYRRGGAFYNFSGLREFKQKFRPEWRPRFLAHTGTRSVARVMLEATFIISRGPRGLPPPAAAHEAEAEDALPAPLLLPQRS